MTDGGQASGEGRGPVWARPTVTDPWSRDPESRDDPTSPATSPDASTGSSATPPDATPPHGTPYAGTHDAEPPTADAGSSYGTPYGGGTHEAEPADADAGSSYGTPYGGGTHEAEPAAADATPPRGTPYAGGGAHDAWTGGEPAPAGGDDAPTAAVPTEQTAVVPTEPSPPTAPQPVATPAPPAYGHGAPPPPAPAPPAGYPALGWQADLGTYGGQPQGGQPQGAWAPPHGGQAAAAWPPPPQAAAPGPQPGPGQPAPGQQGPGQPGGVGWPGDPNAGHPQAAHAQGPQGAHPQGPGGGPPTPGFPPPPPPGRRSRGHRRTAVAAAVVGAVLLSGLVGGVVGSALSDGTGGGRQRVELPDTPAADTARAPESVAGVAASVLQSVVSIRVRSGEEGGTGSGFVIDTRGYILTNNHVVAAGGTDGRIDVTFQDGSRVDAEVVGADESYDLAVIKVEADGLRAVQLGNSDGVVVGDPVVAIGAPLGLQGTVTTGIVSALNRPVAAGDGEAQAFINAIQTDAAINPGNSGGPLVDTQGRVIGVNSAIARVPGISGTTAGSIGLGFSIPSNQAKRTAEELIATGKSSHPIIGVVLDRNYEGEGVRVAQTSPAGEPPPVTPDGPADKAGIQPGDVITRFNDRPVTEPDELIVAIRAQEPGDTVTLTVRRSSGERKVEIVLVAAPDE